MGFGFEVPCVAASFVAELHSLQQEGESDASAGQPYLFLALPVSPRIRGSHHRRILPMFPKLIGLSSINT